MMNPTHGSSPHRTRLEWLVLLLLTLAAPALIGQMPATKPPQKGGSQERYTYTTVPGDPLATRIYKLSNGLTVMMTVNKLEPRINTMIATRGGSKNDPATNTGLAHYLEHMLFKGTDRLGTSDFATEKIYLDRI